MSQTERKMEWCLRKAEKELKVRGKHKGLVKIEPNMGLAAEYIRKAEHNLKAITDFKKIGYSDWSASAAFYSIYHCLLAIITKFGYESGNQECTFALIHYLIETRKIDFNIDLIRKIHLLNPDEKQEVPTIIEVREAEQYGVKCSLEDETFNKLLKTARAVLDRTKEILEE